MDDYHVKRRYRQRKLIAKGFYERWQRRSRARRRAEQEAFQGALPSMEQIFHPENLIAVSEDLKRDAGHAPGPDGIGYDQLGRRETGQIMRGLSKQVLDGSFEPSEARHVRIPKNRAVAPPTADRPGISTCPRLESSQGIPAAASAPFRD